MNKKTYNLIYYDNPILKIKCKRIEKLSGEDVEFANILINLMLKYDGIGLAANQIGDNRCIIAIGGVDPLKSPAIFINPTIIRFLEPIVTFEEGCLSFPKLYLSIDRPEGIIVEYYDINFKKQTLEAHQLLARVLQHEIDHINGIRFIDRIPETKLENITSVLESINRRYNG